MHINLNIQHMVLLPTHKFPCHFYCSGICVSYTVHHFSRL